MHTILESLFLRLARKAAIRRDILTQNRNPQGQRQAPGWGMLDSFARHALYLFFALWFSDLGWRKCRRLAADPESLRFAGAMLRAFSQGFRSVYEYGFTRWLEKRRSPGRYLALPPGKTVLALPEGPETALLRAIRKIEQDAHAGCGLYYEVYEPRVIRRLRALQQTLSGYDLAVFTRLLPQTGWDISDEAYAASCEAEADAWAEIRADEV